jgi:2-methylcitrate dehydratase PrpD
MASAQLSYQYCTAVAAIEGAVSLRHFDEAHLRDPAINALCAKVSVAVDAQCEADYPRLRSAQVEVVTRSGERHHAYLDEPRGSARYPLSDESVIEKFMDLATPVLGQSRSVALKDSIWSIEKLADPEMLLSRAAKST